MATNPHPPTPTPPPPADARYDELRGVYGFFRRHQKKLLYTAGLFTLLTFSITGPMMQLATSLFGTPRPMPTILVAGKRVQLQEEDDLYGDLLARNIYTALPYGVLPPIDPGEGGSSRLGEALAILRRAAITEGIEVSMVEVDRAIEMLRELLKAPSAAKVARDRSFASLQQYRMVVGEAMRIGTYIRLQTLALDSTDARVLDQLVSDREKITLKVATFDEKALEAQLKAATTVSDDDLRKWLDGKSEREKVMIQVYDVPVAELRFGALLFADGQFDPAQWPDELKDFTVSDEQLQNLYNADRDLRFKIEGQDNQYRPFDDAAVKQELTHVVKTAEVMAKIWERLRLKQEEQLKPRSDDLARAQAELATAQSAAKDAENQLTTQKGELTAREAELAQKPGDPTLQQSVDTLKAAIATLETTRTDANNDVPVKQKAVDAATQALKDARAAFDFPAEFAALTAGKSGFVQKAITGKKSAEEMKDLDALDLELGKWPLSVQGISLQNKGELCFEPGRTSKAMLVYQATDLDRQPMKPWDKLRPLLEGAYWTEQAKKQGEDKKKSMEETLLRLAKAKIADKVAEIEGKRTTRVDEKLAAWEKKTQDAIALAERTLQGRQPGTQMYIAWQQDLQGKQAELAAKEKQRTLFDDEVKKLIETEIADEAKKVHKDVLEEAAAECGFTVAPFGPFARDVAREPRFDKDNDPTVVFLMRSHSTLAEGVSTGVVQDMTNRRLHVAVCTKVEPLSPADVTRRDFESMRTGDGQRSFATQQAMRAYGQAFTIEALTARYDLQRPVGEQTEQAKVGEPTGK